MKPRERSWLEEEGGQLLGFGFSPFSLSSVFLLLLSVNSLGS